MNFNVTFDWKSILAIGASVVGIIFAAKLDSCSTENVLIHGIDSCANVAIADHSNC